MTVEAPTYPNGGVFVSNGDLTTTTANAVSTTGKKSKETERRRRRRKQKKNKASQQPDASATDIDDDDGSKENTDPLQGVEQVEIEYVPEKAALDDEEFRRVFEKFSFIEPATTEEDDKKDESAQNAESKKKADSDSEDEEQDNIQKEKGVSNKKKKLQRRMKIAELKEISSRPDVVEVWDATASDPKLLVFLKSYRNTVPVPRHWCQKRKFLQESGCDYCGAWACMCLAKGTLFCFRCLYLLVALLGM